MTEDDKVALAIARERVRHLVGPVPRVDTRDDSAQQQVYEEIRARMVAQQILKPRLNEEEPAPETAGGPQLHTIYVCGRSACHRMVEVMENGEQVRRGRPLSIIALKGVMETQGVHVMLTRCDQHEGPAFPTTEQLQHAMSDLTAAQPLPPTEG